MHLIAATPGAIADGTTAVDPGQTAADVVFLSAADSELALLSQARAAMTAPPSLRLLNLSYLAHPASVDLHLDACATGSQLVIARILGGVGYWRYGLAQYSARLHAVGVPFVALPGDDRPDVELRALSTVPDADYDALFACCVEGGPDNAITLLAHARAMISGSERPAAARPLVKAGLYWPGLPHPDLGQLRALWLMVLPAADPAAVPPVNVKEPVSPTATPLVTTLVPVVTATAPVVPIIFYRSLLQGGGLDPINRLIRALLREGLAPLPVFVGSLKDPLSHATLETILADAPPSVILNATSFATGSAHPDMAGDLNPLAGTAANQAPVLQVILSGGSADAWATGTRGLSATDIAMNVALPEVDGRILTRAISFKDEALFDEATQCRIVTYRALADRVAFVAKLTANCARLRAKPAQDRKVAIILANYPNKDGRLANGVGLDTPAATVLALQTLANAGYGVTGAPATGQALMDRLMAGPTNWLTDRAARDGGETLLLATYANWFATLPWSAKSAMTDRWGSPAQDPFIFAQISPPEAPTGLSGAAQPAMTPAILLAQISPPEAPTSTHSTAFALSLHRFGNVVVGLQPARGYNIDPTETYHSPDLIPPHNYLAFYQWLRDWGVDAIVHMGKHGNLEWLPGKAVALSDTCWPEIALGPIPHLYPFIVNDPGEGTQAKRRAQAVILDHLTPPLTRAETYGPLRDLEALVDEYYEAQGVDPHRTAHLRREIVSLTQATGLALDAGMTGADEAADLQRLDAWLCAVKEAQIRDGLHIFGLSPTGVQDRDLTIALARVPRGDGKGANASLIRALADDLDLGFDPLLAEMAEPWSGPRPDILALTNDLWRTAGDTVERLELLAQRLVGSEAARGGGQAGLGSASAAVLDQIATTLRPAIAACGPAETNALLTALDGRAIAPGPSGAPTRGRPDVLPTGRNFFSVDARAVPTTTAWALGWQSANLMIEKHLQDHGDWPRTMLVTAWGTANMRTGGDDIAQALALMGVKPTWDNTSRRVTGFEVLPLGILARPRVDVTLRISGFFRDAFPHLIALVDSAARAVQALDEPADQNPAAARTRAGESSARVYGAKPGAYGAGLQALIDERIWTARADLGNAYLDWGGYAYAAASEGTPDRAGFASRLTQVEAIVQNQDNREHDILDSDDYYQFHGGAAAAVTALQGRDVPQYHNDHSRPERPVIRTLTEEVARVIRSRVVNPKWIAGVMRHGYKGAFEMAATVDYLFAFAASTGAVRNHHFDLVEAAYLEDDSVRDFIATVNPPALREIADRLAEAIDRGLWVPRSNSARARIDGLRGAGRGHVIPELI